MVGDRNNAFGRELPDEYGCVGADGPAEGSGAIAFPGEVETGSPSGNATNKDSGSFQRFDRKLKRSSAAGAGTCVGWAANKSAGTGKRAAAGACSAGSNAAGEDPEDTAGPFDWTAACVGAAQEIAASAYDMTHEQMLAKRRCRAWIAEGRQVAMYLSHVIAQVPLSDVAPHFGRDRTTVAHACRVIEDRRDDDYFDTGLTGLESLMMQRIGEIKLQKLLREQLAREAEENPDAHITIEKPMIIRTAKGKFYTFRPLPQNPPGRPRSG